MQQTTFFFSFLFFGVFFRVNKIRHFMSFHVNFVCVAVLRPSQPNGVMSSAISLPNHMFTGQA